MRGSVYYQTSVLAKLIFEAGAKKEEKINEAHSNYLKVSSYKTMETYRNIWNNFFNYLKEHWLIKNCEQINSEHIQAYMEYKIDYYPSKQYLEKISAAIGKLEIALKMFTISAHGIEKNYDFSIRQDILDESRDLNLVANNYHNRCYKYPKNIIANLTDSKHQLAAKIQLEGGARIEGVALIKKEQLHGISMDKITNAQKGVIFTKEKGGKEGDLLVSVQTYNELKNYISEFGHFKINRQKYYENIKQACLKSKENPEGSHGFRWNFAKNRMMEYAKAGYSYQESLLGVSSEMKHNRASITEHYLGG